MRTDPVLVVALSAVAGQAAAVAPLPACLGALGVALVLGRRARAAVWLAALVVFAVGSWRAGRALDAFETERVRVRDALAAPARCAVNGRVVASPTRTGDSLGLLAELHTLDCEERRVATPVRVRLHTTPVALRRGDGFEAVVQIAPLQIFRNPGARDATPQAARRAVVASGSALAFDVTERAAGPASLVDRAREHARERILATFSPSAQGMARALVLGENDLDADDDAAFRKSGLSHMLAVSGTHLVFAVVALVGMLRALLVRIEALAARTDVARLASLIGIPLALVYADFAGGSGSAWRAAFMLTAVFVARAAGRAPHPARALALSLGLGALLDPLVAFDISFLLSAAATSGLLAIGPSLAAPCRKLPRVPRFVGQSVAATLASMLPCAPLLAVMAPELTFAGVLANVLAAPFGETVALPLCLSHLLLEAVPPLERGVALVASGALVVVKQIAHESAAQRALAFGVPEPGGYHLALVAVGGAGLFVTGTARSGIARAARLFWTFAVVLSLAVVELACRRAGRPTGIVRVTAIDVGQGDATLVDFPDGSAWLVDAGGVVGSPVDPGAASVVPLLRARRRERLDVVVLSHPHPDHFGGLPAVFAAVPVGELWDSGQGEREGAGPVYAELLHSARAKGTRVLGPAELCGKPRIVGGARVELIAPCPAFVPGRDANDNSLVLRVSYGTRAALLMGDAEATEERELVLRESARLRADLLKIGHHGSRTSTSDALLHAVRPTWATISCGVRNRFGHPHAPVLARLAAHDIHPIRLDRAGGAIWVTDGRQVGVTTATIPH
ncbi:MAG TPA: DNA internalization-related competence protein ComEC/Rec2 [Polyangiaceae bacterium]